MVRVSSNRHCKLKSQEYRIFWAFLSLRSWAGTAGAVVQYTRYPIPEHVRDT